MINGMDIGYVKVCREYIKQWTQETGFPEEQFSEEIINYIIEKTECLRDLEESFEKIVSAAQEYRIEEITLQFVETVLS